MSLSFKESLNQISSGDFIGNGGNWQNHPSYTHSDIYTDRSISTISSKKNIRLNSRQFNITQEENSQYIPFEMPRFYDGLDLVDATISIHYETSGERHGAAQPINVIYNDNKIRFGWLIDSNVTSDPGKLKFEIHAYGVVHGANGETTAYVWKSKSNEKLNVLQSICSTDEVITAVDDSWVQELVTDITERVAESLRDVALNEQVQAAVHDAKQYADDLNATTSNKIKSIDKEIDVIFDEIENFSADSVQYVAQTLTDTQMAQARKNINANGFDWHAIGEDNGYAANMGNYNSITDWDRLLAVPSSTNSSAPAFGELLTAASILLTGYDKSASKENALKDFNAAILDLSSAGILPSDYRIVHTLDVENTNKYLFVIMQYDASNNRWILTDQTGDVARFIAVTGDEIIDDTTLTYPDTTLSIDGRAADAKAVGQALDLKAELEHNHKISNIDGLQVALDNKASLLHDHDGDYDAKGAAGTAETNAKAYTDELANGQVKTNKEAIAKLNGAATEEGSVAKAVADAKALIDADIDAVEAITGKNKEDIAAINNAESGILAQAKAYADAEDAKIEKSVGDLATLVGTLPEGTTAKDVVEYVNVKTSGIATDTAPGELQGQLSSVQGEVAAIKGDYLKSADKAELEGKITEVATAVGTEKSRAESVEAELETRIAAIKGDYLKAADKTELQGNIDTLTGVVETLRDGIDADKVDGVKDLIAYVEEHGPEVTGMKEDIAENAEAIEGVAGRMTTVEGKITAVEGAVATKVEQSVYDEKVAALEGADVGLSGRITAIENKFGGAEGSVEDMIADAKQEAIDAAAGDATTKANAAKDAAIAKANELNTAMNTRVEALEAIDHDHNTLYYTKTQIDTKISTKSDSAHNHDSVYDTKGSASNALAEANAYTKETCNALAENFDSAIAMMYGADITEDLTTAPTIRDIATNVYMENRTHGIELDSTEQLLPDTVVNIDEYGSGGYITTPIEVITGETYLVKWDGKKYLCTVKETLMEGSGQVQILGNAKAAGASDIEPSNEPFVILILPAETAIEMGVYGAIMATDGTINAEITVSIEGGLVETYMPLDIRYLPEEVVTSKELAEAIEAIEAPETDLTGYATETYVQQQINAIPSVDLSKHALKSEIPTKVSEFTNDSGYLVASDIADKADSSHNHDSAYASKSLYGDESISVGRESNTTVGHRSFAFGLNVKASDSCSHAEGNGTTASGGCSHAEGYNTTASAVYSHAEGNGTTASGGCSHAEGDGTTTTYYASHVEGCGTIATSNYQHVQGKYNINNGTQIYAHIVGNGTADDARSNAHSLDWDGNAWFAGEVYVGGSSQDSTTKEKLVKASELGDYITDCSVFYGVCSTAADTAAKTVTVDKFELKTGAFVIVKFENSNSASNPTLNVNGTGAKPIYRYDTTVASTGTTTTGWTAGAVQMFVYDGNGWIRDYWNNTTYSNAALGQGYGTCSTAAATTAKVVSLSSYTLTAGGIVSVKFTNDVPANATLNINSKGAKNIYYRGAKITSGIIKAGDIATFIYSSQYHLLAVDRQINEYMTEAQVQSLIDTSLGVIENGTY